MNSLFMHYSALIILSPLLKSAQMCELTPVNGSSAVDLKAHVG